MKNPKNIIREIKSELMEHRLPMSSITRLHVVFRKDDGTVEVYERLEDIPADAVYECMFGTKQNIFGSILLDNGGWLERGQFDGVEWWSYRTQDCLEPY